MYYSFQAFVLLNLLHHTKSDINSSKKVNLAQIQGLEPAPYFLRRFLKMNLSRRFYRWTSQDALQMHNNKLKH